MAAHVGRGRALRRAAAGAFTCMLVLGIVPGFGGLAWAQGWGADIGLGVVASTPLLKDGITGRDLERLGLPDREVDGVTLRAAAAPMVVVRLRRATSSDLSVEAKAGWTASRVVASTAMADRELQGLGVGHGAVGLRHRIGSRFHGSAGIGVVRYAGGDRGIFREGPVVEPLVELGGGGVWQAGSTKLTLDLSIQSHGFGTPALRREGGVDGRVYRFALVGGVALGAGVP